MDQLYPLTAGTTTSSCASQDFDFLNYWVDQTVEKEILRGKKLRELKRPPARKEKFDVINIRSTNDNCEKKRSNRRRKAPRKSGKKGRQNSPHRLNSPTTRQKDIKRDSKWSRQRCPMRIAELAVPSKRQCIDTWRNKYHVLPGIMIDRLRQHVLDLSPVVKIPDAIECFKRHKCSKRRKTKSAKESKSKSSRIQSNFESYDDTIMKNKSTKLQECRYLCAIFGHKIAKELNKPVQITLNTELEKISNVVSTEIGKLVNNGRMFENRNVRNKIFHADVAGKVSIWIANILDETAHKILEDQLRDLEDEVGPVLDFIDDLVDNVVDVCEPEPEVIEVSSSSDTYNVESITEYNNEEDLAEMNELKEEQEGVKEEESYTDTADDNISVEVDFPTDGETLEGKLDDFIKTELDNIISSFDGDTDEVEDTVFEDVNDQIEASELSEVKDIINKEQIEFQDASDSFEVPINESETIADTVVLEESSESNENTLISNQEKEDDETMQNNAVDIDKTTDPDNNANINMFTTEDDSNKKVKFSDINIVTNDDTKENQAAISQNSSEFINANQVFAEPNDNLLSSADESWPQSMTPPIIRPSESVSKSITSLGKIMEAEERISVLLDDDENFKLKEKVDGTSVDAEQIEDNTGISNEQPNLVNKPINDSLVDTVPNAASENERIVIDINIDGKQQELEKDIIEPTDQIVGKDAQKIQDDLNQLSTDEGNHRSSTESTFDHHVPTETVAFEQTLENILEDEANQVAVELEKILEEEASQVVANLDKMLEDEGTQGASQDETLEIEAAQVTKVAEAKNVEIKTDDKATNTSFSLVPREDKSTSVVSQSLGDITKRLEGVKADDMFSSLRIKPKVDYKVHKNSAPSWVTQNYGEPSDSLFASQQVQKKHANDKNIRLWCKDLENGFANLELWNNWIENTLDSVKDIERKKARICLDKSREEFVRDWLYLKKNVDADVLTWTKQSKSTQDKVKCFRRIYQNVETPKNTTCNCHK